LDRSWEFREGGRGVGQGEEPYGGDTESYKRSTPRVNRPIFVPLRVGCRWRFCEPCRVLRQILHSRRKTRPLWLSCWCRNMLQCMGLRRLPRARKVLVLRIAA